MRDSDLATDAGRPSRLRRGARWLERLVDLFTLILLWIAGFVIFGMMLATVYDVAMRYIFRAPTGWVLTTSSAALPIFTFMAAPALLWSRRHIDMDLLYRSLGARGRAFADVFVNLATLAFSAMLARLSYQATVSTYMNGLRTSGNFSLPLWYLYAAVYVGSLLMAVVALVTPWRLLKGRPTAPAHQGEGHIGV